MGSAEVHQLQFWMILHRVIIDLSADLSQDLGASGFAKGEELDVHEEVAEENEEEEGFDLGYFLEAFDGDEHDGGHDDKGESELFVG